MPPSPTPAASLLRTRRALSVPPSTTASSYTLPLKRLVLDYCEHWGSNVGMRQFISSGQVVRFAERHPGVEVIVRRKENRHPALRGIYVNGRDKVICVRSLPPSGIEAKLDLLVNSSGAKVQPLKRPTVESTTESVRGIWSPFHEGAR